MMESVVIVTVDYVSRMIGGGIGIEMFAFFQQLEDCPLMVILYIFLSTLYDCVAWIHFLLAIFIFYFF